MALMEYCLVNIVLGDADMPPRMSKKSFDFSFRVRHQLLLLLFLMFSRINTNARSNGNSICIMTPFT